MNVKQNQKSTLNAIEFENDLNDWHQNLMEGEERRIRDQVIDDDSVHILMDRMNAMGGELRNAWYSRLPIHYTQVDLDIRTIVTIISFMHTS